MNVQFWLGLAIIPESLSLPPYFWETVPLTKYGDFRKLVPDNLPDGLYNVIVTLFLSPKIRTLCIPGWQIVFVRQYKLDKYKANPEVQDKSIIAEGWRKVKQ